MGALTRSALMVALVLSLLVGYYQLRHALWKLVSDGGSVVAVFALLLVVVLAFSKVRYSSFSQPYGRLHRLVSLAILVFLLIDPADLTVVNLDKTLLATQITVCYWLAVVLALVSIFRPAALLFPSFYLYLAHALSEGITGYPSHRLASVTLVETAQFLSLGVLALAAIRKLNQSQKLRSRFVRQLRLDELALCLMFVAISLHLSHYFWSGYEKFKIGEHLWSWVTDNQTQNLILSAMYRGTLPSINHPSVTQWLFDSFSVGVQWLNTGSVLVQVLAVVAILHVSTLRVFTLIYDALHIGIYLVTGLLLWPWVANNAAIYYSLRGVARSELTWSIRWCCVITIIFGGLQHFGNASRLAWWDLRDITGIIVQAQVTDGTWRDVPLSYFNSHGQMVSMLMAQVQLPGHYSPTGWGASGEYNQARATGACIAPSGNFPIESVQARTLRKQSIEDFLSAHHKKLIEREQQYSSSHPYPSLRYLNSASKLPIGIESVNEIQDYRYVMQSACLNIVDGELLTTVIAQDVTDVDVIGRE